jgi:transcriptional regulator with GAF, ATPase, and Fis domain
MREIRSVIEQIGETDVTVLIQGESGVGKEIVAREVHEVSSRAKNAFVKVNCAALPTNLLESELFGYEKGAFTGAFGRKQGKFEQANGGTIFLDEIGEMCPSLQAKLLQVLQDSEFTRLGGNREVRVDVRVVCATNRSLTEMVAD